MTEPVVEDARLSELLAAPSTWIEPRSALEDLVVRAVTDAARWSARSEGTRRARARRARRRRWLVGLGAAAALVAAVVVAVSVTMTRGEPPLEFSGTLAATSLAPRAHADVEITKTRAGFQVVLEAHRLPPLGPGRYYEAWLRDAAGTAVPIGTFSSGREYVTLWSGVSPRRLSTMTITSERTDNDQTSSGRVVLVGTLRARSPDS